MKIKKNWIKTGILGGILMCTLTFNAIQTQFFQANIVETSPFMDIADSPYEADIIELHSKDLIAGKTETIFSPYEVISRGEALAFIIKVLKNNSFEPEVYTKDLNTRYPDTQSPFFDDVSKKDWYAPYIGYAKESGLLEQKEKFHPENEITRAEFLKLVIEYLSQTKPSILPDVAQVPSGTFTNISESDWYAPYAFASHELGLIPESTIFQEDSLISRGEAAHILNFALGL